ncbi:hypothetical protein EPR50_G00022210 [Perca flavescens]|uniref:Uncharacterized protein n=1 Tax=Perca flavescens TaxID=8167 RepID=A0A484DIV8_PERFV|nr:hypothetical protein EPR50_G00022210 [Perca flavescens]
MHEVTEIAIFLSSFSKGYFLFAKSKNREEDGRPSGAAAADVRAPLEAVELQTRVRFGETRADVSARARRESWLGMTCEPTVHRSDKQRKDVCAMGGSAL